RYLFICALAVIWAISACEAGAAETNVKEYSVGKAAVWAIADSMGDRDMSAFPNADPKAVSQYAPSGKSPSATMVFLVKTGNEVILIDTGNGIPSGDRVSRLGEGLKIIGVTPEEITMVLITHMHGDHIGGLVKGNEKAFPSARVLSSRIEHDFWTDVKSEELFPARKSGFEMARKIFGLYGPASETFEFGSEVAPGIKTVDASGHTPGQTAFLLESEGEKLLFWGDIVHAAALQFPRPDICASYDMDVEKSVKARFHFMEMAAAEKLPVAGTHLPFPAVGTVEKDAGGGYLYKSR
ncbi:MAG: MBL fold metallo-hydrolase, partial [Synergistaceae bacterium]|nr:MBL fold metallo-hydrolase [Synergistaceae bacterium]